MATSSIKIYRTHITPSRNALVDDIEVYLNGLTPIYTNTNFQYLKLGLDLKIVLNVNQDTISKHNLGNYCRVVEDGKIWYYFVLNTEWKSEKAVELSLSIDSINTFRNNVTWSKKTTIAREHKDRLSNYGLHNVGEAVRIIDKQPENINALKLKQSDKTVWQSNLNFDWYLMYRTADLVTTDPNSPVNCYLLADRSLVVSKTGGGASQTLTVSDLPTGQYNYVLDDDNPDFSFNWTYTRILRVGSTTSSSTQTAALVQGGEFMVPVYETAEIYGVETVTKATETIYKVENIKFVSNGSNIILLVEGSYLRNGTVHTGNPALGQWTPSFTGYCAPGVSSPTTGSSLQIVELNFTRVSYDGSIPLSYAQQLISDTMTYNIGTQVTRSIVPYSSVDKTDSRIIKIIKLPYCPVEVRYVDGVYVFPAEWTYSAGYMKLNDASLATEFSNTFYSLSPSSIINYTIPEAERTIYTPRSIDRESKLYNSDFFTYKYIYDSFANEIRWENFYTEDWYTGTRPLINFTFKPTNTINSKFDIYSNYKNYYAATGDYEGHLIIDRNNEETIFSNDFINYIRTGYNYDKKAKQQSTAMSYLGASVALVGAITSFATAGITGGVSAAAGISLATTAITSFASAAATKATNERAIESKLESLKAQATAVSGADDVDLMTYYTDNRMHLITYTTEEVQRNAIYDLFFYCGYACNRMGIPNITSRYWFNYIMCKPVFTDEGVNPYNDFIDDIKARYQSGVTVYHHHGSWDWAQQYENWEVDIAESFESLQLPNINDLYLVYDGTELYASTDDEDYTPSNNNTYRYELWYVEDGGEVMVDQTVVGYWQLGNFGDDPTNAIGIKCRLIDISGTMRAGAFTTWDLQTDSVVAVKTSLDQWIGRNVARDGEYDVYGVPTQMYAWRVSDSVIGLTTTREPEVGDLIYFSDNDEIVTSRTITDLYGWRF